MMGRYSTLTCFLAIFFLLLSRPFVLADFEGFDPEEEEDVAKEEPLDPSVFNLADLPLTQSHSNRPETPDPEPETLTQHEPHQSLSSSIPEYWDEDEFEGLPISSKPVNPEISSSDSSQLIPNSTAEPIVSPKKQNFTVEIICVSFLLIFAINFFTGKRENENIALAWASKFATRDSIFEKNFSLLGIGEGNDAPLLLKEGHNSFKFYASGRRFCQGLLATIELKSRHDLISRLYNLIVPSQDEITFQVLMNDDAMDHVIFAIARKKLAKFMLKEERDLQRFASLTTQVPTGKKWVPEELSVISESKEVAGDLITDLVLDQVFSERAFEKHGKYFISLHFSDQFIGTHKNVLSFKFSLPDAKNMGEMTRLVALVPYYIDLIGRYKLSSQARSKTEVARLKVAQEAYKEMQGLRQEAIQKKKAEKRRLLEEAEAKLSAEALRKKESKDRSRQIKKQMPKMKITRA